MRMSYDQDADALYIQIRKRSEGEDRPRTKELSKGVMMDMDADGHPIGFEILWASERYPSETFGELPGPHVYLSLAQAAERTGLSAGTLKVQANAGRLRAEKHGRNWVTTEAWLGEYLSTRRYNAKKVAP